MDIKEYVIGILIIIIIAIFIFRCDFLCDDCDLETDNDADDDDNTYYPPITYTCGDDYSGYGSGTCGGTCPNGQECVEFYQVQGYECGCKDSGWTADNECEGWCMESGVWESGVSTDSLNDNIDNPCHELARAWCIEHYGDSGIYSLLTDDCCCWECGIL